MEISMQPEPMTSQGQGHPGQTMPLRDMGSFVFTSSVSDAEIHDHRSAVDTASAPRHLHKTSHHGRHRHRKPKPALDTDQSLEPEGALPSKLIQFLLEGDDTDVEHRAHDMFCEMAELFSSDDGGIMWKETARWVKFEEDVEEGGERWSKPHVATLSLHSLFELRSCLHNGSVVLDMEGEHFEQVIDSIIAHFVKSKQLPASLQYDVRDVLIQRHRHLKDKPERRHHDKMNVPIIRSLAEIGRKYSLPKEIHHHGATKDALSKPKGGLKSVMTMPSFQQFSDSDGTSPVLTRANLGGSSHLKTDSTHASDQHLHTSPSSHKLNSHFMKKINPGTEAANILVGEVDFLSRQVVAFVRLSRSACFGDLTEIPVPTRFLFVLLGPTGWQSKYHEIGRSIATLMSDEIFHDVAYHARNRDDLLAGIDEFLDQVTVLPPGEWDPSIRIEPPKSVPSQEGRKGPDPHPPIHIEREEGKEIEDQDENVTPLQRTGRLFGGLRADIKRKAPFYRSDFKDSLHVQSLASFLFLYFACLMPIITYGGLLAESTHNQLGVSESILAGALVGVSYALFSGQPLTIMGSTGAVLMFESLLNKLCVDHNIAYLPFRWWVGMWTGIILIIMVAFDISALVRYITRFTEESFAALISLIFIKEVIEELIRIIRKSPINRNSNIHQFYDCVCAKNETAEATTTTAGLTSNITASIHHVTTAANQIPSKGEVNVTAQQHHGDELSMQEMVYWDKLPLDQCSSKGGTLVGEGCGYVADVFFLSLLLVIGTLVVIYIFKALRNSRFLPATVRVVLSEFAVVIAILALSVVDWRIGVNTPKLEVPQSFTPTNPARSWIVSPVVSENPWWLSVAAIVPAILATVLLFMDQQITAVIVNRKENKLQKGCGYHLDLFIVAVLIMVCSSLGLPWFVADTVMSINHVRSLRKESVASVPGERPSFLGVRENRVTGVAIFLLIGLSVLLTGVLKFVPMPVLYGVFLYMGLSAMSEIQLVDRLRIMFMPIKYQPDFIYLRHVKTRRVHMFTIIQSACLVLVGVVEMFRHTAWAFPIMVLAMCFIRKGLESLFTKHELKWLDDIMPETHHREEEDDRGTPENEESEALLDPACTRKNSGGVIPKSRSIHVAIGGGHIDGYESPFNISQAMSKSAIWKNLQSADPIQLPSPDSLVRNRKHKKHHKPKKQENIEAPAFYIEEEDETETC